MYNYVIKPGNSLKHISTYLFNADYPFKTIYHNRFENPVNPIRSLLSEMKDFSMYLLFPTHYRFFQDPFNPFPNGNILDWSKLKEFADDNFKFDENSRKFSRRVENTVEKGEIARYEQFLRFPQCFQKTCIADT